MSSEDTARQVFLVRRYENITDTWSPWPKTFDEVVSAAEAKIKSPGTLANEYDVVEVEVVRRVRVSSVIQTVTVSEVS